MRASRGSRSARSLHHALILALVVLAAVGALGIAADLALQRDWLAERLGSLALVHIAVPAALGAVGLAAAWRLARAWRAERWTSTRLGPLRALLYTSLAASAGVWLFAQPPLRYEVVIAAGWALGSFSAAMSLARLDQRPPRRWLRALDFALFQLAACVLLAELALRLARELTRAPLFATERGTSQAWIDAYRLEPGSLRFGFRVNSRGFVDRELDPRERARVCCIGDSFSIGSVPHRDHYTSVAERELASTEVYNVGISGAGPREYARLLESEALPLDPELVVIAIFVGNDVTGARDVYAGVPLWTWFDRREVLALEVPRRLYAMLAARPREPRAQDEGERELREDEIDAAFPWLSDPALEYEALPQEEFLRIEIKNALDVLAPARADFEPLFRALEELRRIAGDTPLAVLLIPDEAQVEDAVWDEVRASLREVELDRDLPQRAIATWLEQHGIPHADLLPHLRAAEPLADGRRHVYHRRETHLNARGNKIAGRVLAELIERSVEPPR